MESEEISSSSSRLQTSAGGALAKRAIRQPSIAWQGFELLPSSDNRARKARCKWCHRIYSTSRGTTNLLHHFEHCSERERETCIKRPPLNQQTYHEKVATAIMLHNLPFSFVEQEGIRDLHTFLNIEAQPISRNTIKAEILKMHRRERENLRHALENVRGRVCLTFDLWSSPTTDEYLCLTAHYVDEEWVRRKRVLNFRHTPQPHTGIILATKIINLLGDWGIEKKIFSLTMDNAPYNDALVDCLKHHLRLSDTLLREGKFFHIYCGARVLDLIVKAGLNCIEDSISKIRECVKYVRGNEFRKMRFAECIDLLLMDCEKRVRQDVIHKWNSTYLMLESALEYREAFKQLQLFEPTTFKWCPSEEEWSKVEHVARFLTPFYYISALFSGSKYPTANLFFHGVWKVQQLILEEMESSYSDMREIAMMMNDKFKKYWDCYSLVLSLAIILDPRFKLQFVEYCFSKVHPSTFQEKVKVIREELQLLFDEYSRIFSISLDSSSFMGVDGDSNIDELDEFVLYERQHYDLQSTSELDLYLNERRLPANQEVDVLQFWKENSGRYPNLAILACDILSIPITSVVSESTFSIGGRVIGKHCFSISPDNAEALICTRDWLGCTTASEDEELDEGMTTDFTPIVAKLRSFP